MSLNVNTQDDIFFVNTLDEVVYVITNEDDLVAVTQNINPIATQQRAIQFQDEGVNAGNPGSISIIDFVGANVILSVVGGKLTVTITGGSGSAAWGGITGTITNQSDLIALLANYLTTSAAASTYQPLNLAALKANNLSDLANASTARTNLGLGTLATQSGTFTDKQNLVNSETALVDGATIDLTAIKHTLSTSLGRTFTISYTGDDITLIITLSATSATFTFPATTLCVTNGTASGDNTMAFTGVTSGDKLVIAIKKIGSDYYAIGKNFGQ